MPSTYTLANEDLCEMARELIIKNHIELDSVALKIDFLFVFRDPDGEAPAIMHQGHRALGLASITKLKDRVKGMGDCEIQIDGDAWPNMPYPEKMALLDHELEHFEVRRDKKTGDFQWDDINRPLLKLREHDWQVGFFHNIAGRHGSSSIESKNLRQLFTDAGNSYTPHLRGGVVSIEDLPSQGEDSPVEDDTTVTIEINGVSATLPPGGLRAIAEKLRKES